MVLPTKEIVNIVKTNNMSYVLSYVLIGVLLSFIFDMLNEFVFNNKYKAFIMVTATFAKPYIKYMNKYH